jgi:hypothetical protein
MPERRAVTAVTGVLAAFAMAGIVPPAAWAQSESDAAGADWFPGSFVVAPLRASPREVKMRPGLILADRDRVNDFEGRNLEAQVAIGYRLPVVRLQREAPGTPAIDIGFEAGVVSRFFLETNQGDLINVDYRVGAPVSLRSGRWDVRLELVHVSSHLGDDYLSRFPQSVPQVSREGLELLVGARPGGPFRLYAGGDLSLNRSHGFEITDDAAEPVVEFDTVEKWTVRLGAEWDPSQWGERRIAPFAAADFEVTELTERVATSAVAGVAFRIESIRILLDAEFHDGPSPMGQFRSVDETFWGINATFEL